MRHTDMRHTDMRPIVKLAAVHERWREIIAGLGLRIQ
jgi:hypothetical protein